MEIRLDGSRKTYTISDDTTITLISEQDDEVFFRVNHCHQLSITGKLDKGNIKLIIFNESDIDLNIDEDYELMGANMLVAYGHFSTANVRHNQKGQLNSAGSELSLHTYSLVKQTMKIKQMITNQSALTSGYMKNYAVSLVKSTYDLKATGKIVAKGYQSKNHQVSKCLTFDDLNRVQVLPELIIDENDVEASHAMSVGQMDENQLFYLETRGLSLDQISKLVTYGYVLPLSQLFSDEAFNQKLREEIEKRVETLCLM